MSLWQTKKWQEFLKTSGQCEAYFEVDGIFFEKRQIAFKNFGLFAVGVEKFVSASILKKAQEIALREHSLFIQIESLDYSGKNEELPHSKYYKKFIPAYTVTIDLQKDTDSILKEMKPKGRYNIGVAEKKGIVCKIVEKKPENIQAFYDIFSQTLSRDNFTGNTLQYYKAFLENVPNSELILAYFQDQVIAGGIFVFDDVALYYYGASSNSHRNLMAPYLVQWTAILEAKKRHCRLYDFLGIAGPKEKKSPLAGVTDFKLKFSSHSLQVSGSYLYVLKKKKYFFICLLKRLSTLAKFGK